MASSTTTPKRTFAKAVAAAQPAGHRSGPLPLVLEDPGDMLGGSTVLFEDTVGVVMGHSHGWPTHACLLLAFGDHRIENRRLKVP